MRFPGVLWPSWDHEVRACCGHGRVMGTGDYRQGAKGPRTGVVSNAIRKHNSFWYKNNNGDNGVYILAYDYSNFFATKEL